MNFFNRATNAVETMGKNVSKAAKDNMEIMKCSSAIDSCKEKIELVYMEIGERYYNTEGEVSKEEFSDLFTEIENNQKQIEELENKIKSLKQVMTCKVCGAELSKDAKFCRYCGSKVKDIVVSPSSGLECWNCHSPLRGDERFCASCGAKSEVEVDEEQSEMEKVEKVQPQVCSVCGKEVKDTDTFCKFCGNEVR